MKIITITVNESLPGYTAHDEGQPVLTAGRLAEMREPLLKRLWGIRGKIVYLRPSWPGQTTPVVFADTRPELGYSGGPWASDAPPVASPGCFSME
ncbi:hypothetical protein QGN06_25495 [Achromobacter xylosoxidans]|uniref:hypothetical protein n=1 Tax=Alcaligenes xylosoxydans xylosoxydans TaxID=85698 RepID=UPI000AD961CD|nr:hypothetical protein [Achromobacter xylosoxidans]